MNVKGNCGGQIPIDSDAFDINANGELTINKGAENAVPFKNIKVDGDAVINHLDVTDSIVLPIPSDLNEAANKGYVDSHYITSPNGTVYQIKVADDGTLSTSKFV